MPLPPITLPAAGGCLCGRLTFSVTAAPLCTVACHCTGCQHMSASAYSLTVMVPTSGFAVTAGTPVRGALHRPETQHWHCGECLCWMYTTFEPDQGFVNVRATQFADRGWFVPFVETMAAEKLAWVDLPVRRSYPAWPPAEDFPTILKDYAER